MKRLRQIIRGDIELDYWTCQLLGWGTVSLYWLYAVMTQCDYGLFFSLLNYVLDVGIGLGLTHLYRSYAKATKLNKKDLGTLFVRVLPALFLLSVAFVIFANLKWYLYRVYLNGETVDFWNILFHWDPILITALRLIAIWILAYHLYHYHRYRLETIEQNAALQLIAKQAQLDNLSTQLNPHFLFNSLNSIKSLVIENPAMARRAVDLLSDILRTSLYQKEMALISLKEELSLVKDYVALEKIRFEERLDIRILMKEELAHYKVLPLSIQLLVENAIKHGIDKRVEGGEILIEVRDLSNNFEIYVENPGHLDKISSSSGIGLENLAKRLELHYNGQADFRLENKDLDRVRATLIIPKEGK